MFERRKSAGKIYQLPVEAIRPSPFQARTSFNEQELAGLAQSIRENGLLQPISVRRVEGGYELVARGAAAAGLQTGQDAHHPGHFVRLPGRADCGAGPFGKPAAGGSEPL